MMVRGARGCSAVQEADDEAASRVDEQNRKRKGESVRDERQQPAQHRAAEAAAADGESL